MCNTAAVVVERVLQEVPVRQWVLSAPFELRLLLARHAPAFGLHAVVVDGVFEKAGASDDVEGVQFHALPPGHPTEFTAIAYVVYRRFTDWLKKNGLMKTFGDDDTYEDENPLAACLRGSLGIGQVVELDEAGDVQESQEQAAPSSRPEGQGHPPRDAPYRLLGSHRRHHSATQAPAVAVLWRVRVALVLAQAVRASWWYCLAAGVDELGD